MSKIMTPRDALKRLQEGNDRFVAGQGNISDLVGEARRQELVAGQNPFAIILGCSDSRVPAEIIFDQGLGDLFVIRVAGNIVAPSLIGSVEYAAELLNTRLVVVLGHSSCGAVQAAVDQLSLSTPNRSPNLRAIVDFIRPAVAELMETELRHDRQKLVAHSVRANVRASANHLRHGSAVLERLIAESGLLVVGAEYSLASGRVDFFDGMPEGEI